jgi:nitrogen fixation/metabolism regulation signal transduction histidine kinase
MPNPNRKLSNFLLTPKFQLKLTYYYIGIGVAIILATTSAVFFKMTQIRDVMNNSVATDFTAQSQITEFTFQIAQISMLGFVAFAIASFIFALMVSHRIAGPIVAITAYIDELIKGNYEYGRKLRPEDELTLIMDGLHELNSALKKRNSD